MDAPDTIAAAKALGLTLPTPAYLFFAIVFGVAGIAAFRLGRRRERPPTVAMGVALMFYPYLVSSTAWLVAIGLALCAMAGSPHAATLTRVQNDLFDLGADLATPGEDFAPSEMVLRIVPAQGEWLERAIDAANALIAPLTSGRLRASCSPSRWRSLSRPRSMPTAACSIRRHSSRSLPRRKPPGLPWWHRKRSSPG